MIELRHYRYIVAVERAGGFSRAALALGISTPTLSVQVKYVEDLLGAPIFERTSQKLSVTTSGREFIKAARDVLAAAAAAEEIGRYAARGEAGKIFVGYVGSAAYGGTLQRIVSAFRQRFPRAMVIAAEYQIEELPVMVESRSIDFALVRAPLAPGAAELRKIGLTDDSHVVALSSDHPLAAMPDLPIEAGELADSRFVVPEQFTYGTNELARRGGFVVDVQSVQRTLIGVLTQVSLGGCAAIVPGAVSSSVLMPGVVFRELAGEPILSGIVGLYRRDEASPLVRNFLDVVGALERAVGG